MNVGRVLIPITLMEVLTYLGIEGYCAIKCTPQPCESKSDPSPQPVTPSPYDKPILPILLL